MIYWRSKPFPDEFMASVASFKSSSVQHDVHFLKYGSINSKIEDKAKMIDKSLMWRPPGFSVSFNQDIPRGHKTTVHTPMAHVAIV